MTSGTREWAEHNRNCIEGCENDCIYCYAKGMAIRFKRRTKGNWHEMKRNSAAYQATRKVNGRIMFPTSHDLHIEHAEWWMPFLRDLLTNGNEVLIVSKPRFDAIRFICSTMLAFRDQIEFRFTIGTNDEESRKFWEPGAPPISERLDALMYAHGMKYPTSVSMEPLLMMNPAPFIRTFEDYVTGTIWIGTMNHLEQIDIPNRRYYHTIRSINSREHMQMVYDSLKDNSKIRWKDSVQKLLGVPQRSP